MLFDLGWREIVLILIIILVIFGVGKLPQIGSSIGKNIREFRKVHAGNEADRKNKKKALATPSDSNGNDTP